MNVEDFVDRCESLVDSLEELRMSIALSGVAGALTADENGEVDPHLTALLVDTEKSWKAFNQC